MRYHLCVREKGEGLELLGIKILKKMKLLQLFFSDVTFETKSFSFE